MLQITDLTYRISGRTIIDSASLHIANGHHCGLVGINGSGKTTLFRLITGALIPDDGLVRITGSTRIGIVTQDAPTSDLSLINFVLSTDTLLTKLEAEAASNPTPDRLAEIHEELRDIEADTAVSRAASILAGLGFNEAAQARPCNEFSGGWRMRVALACTLYAQPDLLLLDEPTNHLDIESVSWLKSYLSRFPGTLIIISHDRDLLNQSVKKIIHLENGKLDTYQGGYDQFRKKATEIASRREGLRHKQLKERARIQSFIDRFKAKATKARQAQSRIKLLEKMDPVLETSQDQSSPLHFPQPLNLLPPPLVTTTNVSVGYGEHVVLQGLNLQIDPDDRIAILGANGLGKSTLVKLLAGRMKPLSGAIQKSQKIKSGYFSQDQTDELDGDLTPYQTLQTNLPEVREERVRSHLGTFGFSASKADTKVSALSGGEKSRLLFALISHDRPNFLVLDEPTNHLDIMGRETLVSALNEYMGAVVLVSHDIHTINLVAERLWLVADGTCTPYDGSLENYQSSLGKSHSPHQQEPSVTSPQPSFNRKAQRKKRAEQRQNTVQLRSSISRSEHKIENLANIITQLEEKLADPETYHSEVEDFSTLSQRLDKARKELSAEEKLWVEAAEKLESQKFIS